MNGWKSANADKILATLAEDCVITESHGPIYRGKEIVKQWIHDWHAKGNRVNQWEMTSFYKCDNTVIFEWLFSYSGPENNEAFEGVTVAKIKDGKIYHLKEYRMINYSQNP
jgi:hypothetical protein